MDGTMRFQINATVRFHGVFFHFPVTLWDREGIGCLLSRLYGRPNLLNAPVIHQQRHHQAPDWLKHQVITPRYLESQKIKHKSCTKISWKNKHHFQILEKNQWPASKDQSLNQQTPDILSSVDDIFASVTVPPSL